MIRPILVVLLVFYHAFAPYGGAWETIEGCSIKAYWWLDWLSFAFMLETFVFISGYVFGYQVRTKGEEKLKAKNLLWGKFKRLMIPCMVFSLLYILLFQDIRQPVYLTAYDLLNGVGHMWFLPMLFWCFVGIWMIEKIGLKSKIVIPLLIVCSLLSSIKLPFELGHTMYYMLFFYIGYLLQRDNVSLDRFYTKKHIVFWTIAFCVLFPALTLLKVELNDFNGIRWHLIDNKIVNKALCLSMKKLIQIIYSSVGLIMLFIMVGYAERSRTKTIQQWVVNIGGLCFGVYLLQQFILMGLYQFTNLPNFVGCYWLPWLGFTVALVVSVVISQLLVKTKTGRFLIG